MDSLGNDMGLPVSPARSPLQEAPSGTPYWPQTLVLDFPSLQLTWVS